MSEETITISLKEYDNLCERYDWLRCLEAAGVSDWNGYEEVQNIRRDMNDGDD